MEMISGRVRPTRDGLPGGNATLSWTLDMITWGHRGLPKCGRRASGVWCGGKFPLGGERGAAAGPADWSGSPQVAPYKCKACMHRVWLRHPGYAVRLRLLTTLQPSGGATRVGERWARSRAIRLAAHALG